MNLKPFVRIEHYHERKHDTKSLLQNSDCEFKNCLSLVFSCLFSSGWKLLEIEIKNKDCYHSQQLHQELISLKKNIISLKSKHESNTSKRNSVKDCYVKLDRVPLPNGSVLKKKLRNDEHNNNVPRGESCKATHSPPNSRMECSLGDNSLCRMVDKKVATSIPSSETTDTFSKHPDLSRVINESFLEAFVVLLDREILGCNNKVCTVVIQRSQLIEDLVLNKTMWRHKQDVIVEIPNSVLRQVGQKRIIRGKCKKNRNKSRIPSISRKNISHFLKIPTNAVCQNKKLFSTTHDHSLNRVVDINYTSILNFLNPSATCILPPQPRVDGSLKCLKSDSHPKDNSPDDSLLNVATQATNNVSLSPRLEKSAVNLNHISTSLPTHTDKPINSGEPNPNPKSPTFLENLHNTSVSKVNYDEIIVENIVPTLPLPQKEYTPRKCYRKRIKRKRREKKSSKPVKDFVNIVTKAMVHSCSETESLRDYDACVDLSMSNSLYVGDKTDEYLHLAYHNNNNEEMETHCHVTNEVSGGNVANTTPPETKHNQSELASQTKTEQLRKVRNPNRMSRKRKKMHNKRKKVERNNQIAQRVNHVVKAAERHGEVSKTHISKKILDMAMRNQNIIAHCQHIIKEKMSENGSKPAVASKSISPSVNVANDKVSPPRQLKSVDVTEISLDVRICENFTVRRLRNIEIISNSVHNREARGKMNTIRICTN